MPLLEAYVDAALARAERRPGRASGSSGPNRVDLRRVGATGALAALSGLGVGVRKVAPQEAVDAGSR